MGNLIASPYSPVEVPIHEYLWAPRNYNPDKYPKRPGKGSKFLLPFLLNR